MARISSGILLYRRDEPDVVVLLVHPGGPFWRKRDLGAWSIPKGEVEPGEQAEIAARREFVEELGCEPPEVVRPLGRIVQGGGKTVEAFAGEGQFDLNRFRCASTVTIAWPPHTGRFQTFPEIDAAAWFTVSEARDKILAGQRPLLDRLEGLLAEPGLMGKSGPD
ncbi:NUDIX domain-containing protein [Chelatococcus asaccharovorans]|uniref:NUDIX domain-containing protein n=1 Tax=Chelatococcus asaccharovorans TaxID=28210 RepID=UPI00224C7640|nr:NUDIX domain-containing protein [Chelatococcus asaccharovorans]CAH1659829.1 putative NUDIX family NTP pyrophosphohydrolase [Chelatococcus asaccharovorans]CAH1684045.1 putative NUDIX family NTP pyrophosphohydrolase [Chelatococcus asaccharovorans]